jgi:predicted RNA polymerase sigma factor
VYIRRSPAIARVNNARAERWEDTDREQTVQLYDMLLHLASSPVTRLHRAIAVRYAAGTPNLMTSPASSAITTCTTPAAPSCCVS